MPTILIADGWDEQSSFAEFTSTYGPRIPVTLPGRVNNVADGSRVPDGYWQSALIFDGVPEDEIAALLSDLGFSDTLAEQSLAVTIYIPFRDRVWKAWNAWADFPTGEFIIGRVQPLTIPLRLVEEVVYSP